MNDEFRVLLVEEVREQGLLEEIAEWKELTTKLQASEATLLPFWSLDPSRWLPLMDTLWDLARELPLDRAFRGLIAKVMGRGYETRCRSALVHAFFGRLDEAEAIVTVAKNDDEGKAFAHHVLGLVRGVAGDPVGARFELWLALEREPYPGARQRIQRALAACG